jgi:hypothetical protein
VYDSQLDLKQARRKRTPDDFEPMFTDDPASVKSHDLDNEKSCLLHGRLLAFYLQELSRQELNRKEQAEEEDFYDNKQWKDEDAAVLEERGQIPLVYNVISTMIDWVLGTERRMRTDFKVLPRRKDGGKQAERKSQLLKYLSDVNRTGFDVSRAFADAVKVGIGWIEDGAQDDSDGEPVYCRYESWRNMLWDSASTQLDLSDCRYVIRVKWVDEDIAVAMFPDRAGTIVNSVDSGTRIGGLDEDGDDPMDSQEDEREEYQNGVFDVTHQRRRVRLIEIWYKAPVKDKIVRGGDFTGEVYDQEAPGHQLDIQEGRAELMEKTVHRMHVAIMTTDALLYVGKSPYRHNRFPFTPVWGKRRGRDNMPYGMIRNVKDIQVDINKRAAKALHILSSNKIIMEEGAVADIDQTTEEASRPDAVLVVKPNKRFELNAERELAPAHLDLMARSINMVQQTSGVTDENMGRSTNATSGRAIMARQDQGSLATSGYFDNLRFARQMQGEVELSLIEQFFTEEKQFRITNMRGKPQYITVNDGLPENDITRTKADFLISEADWNTTQRQAQVAELLQVIQQVAPVNPQVAMAMLDLVVETMDIPSREEIVKRIRSITGQRDPDAEEPTPEEIQQMQAAQAQAEMQQRAMMAEIAKNEATALKSQADAKRAEAGAQEIMAKLAGQNVSTQKAALETALAMLSAPAVVPVADTVLHEAGFHSRTEQEQQAQVEQLQQAQAEQDAMEQQQAEQQMQAQQQAQQQPEQPQQPMIGQQ